MPNIFAIAAVAYGMLYLLTVAFFGYLFGKPSASLYAIADMGLTYLYFSLAFSLYHWQGRLVNCLLSVLCVATILVGAAAGFSLL